jgi:dUTP pyrophosphatase
MRPSFELITKYKEHPELLPTRATAHSAGYDFYVAEDIIIPSIKAFPGDTFIDSPLTLGEVANFTKATGYRPTLVPTGVKAYIPDDMYLQLSVRSSCPLKSWLILANGVGVVDSDYYNNPDNEGHIFFQIINLFPQDIILQKGEKIGQGIFLPYFTTGEVIAAKRLGGFGSTS